MRNTLDALQDYIAFLQREQGLFITIHSYGSALIGITRQLSKLNIHSNPYCIYIKSFPNVWNNCVGRQGRVCSHILENGDEIFFGSCYAGVGEYVVPVSSGGRLYGFISVSGYAGSPEKARHIADKHQIARDLLENAYKTYLNTEIPSMERISALLMPVRYMLLAACREKPPEYHSKDDVLVSTALTYLHRNYAAKIGLAAAADYCHCSRRTLSGLFAARCGCSVGQYIEKLRMDKARVLMKDTTLNVTEVAFLCGYGDANYFSARFGKVCGMSPTEYRKLTEKTPKNGLQGGQSL